MELIEQRFRKEVLGQDLNLDHVMVDIETLGDRSNSVILSIGAVEFDMEKAQLAEDGGWGEKFYEIINIQSCLDAGLKVTGGTISWWMSQSEKAKKEAFKGKTSIEDTLIKFAKFISRKKYYVWSNGLRFDISLLEDAYRTLNMIVPWDFHYEKDVRTLAGFFPEIKQKHIKMAYKIGVPHTPISDCLTQIGYCSEIWNKLNLDTK